MGMNEEVLVFNTSLLNELGNFKGYCSDFSRYINEILKPSSLQYLSRAIAENDQNFKQLIPYAILRYEDTVFSYERGKKGSEARLHSLLSIGVGGHICKHDGPLGLEAYETGFARELEEEVFFDCEYTKRIIGLVHDDSTPVGAVHFGIVHELNLKHPAVRFRDEALTSVGFRTLQEIGDQKDRLESWSYYVAEFLLGKN